ncbi:MAG: thiamine-phosphate kinase [Campylobacteraceae bacterium]|jgi:thiamine-monophosphate kinase|nr:thiamine-phosphate kinase [Campylobacteraceae bacterium]
MDKESFVISQFQNKFIGDDGAVVGKWVYSKDIFAEDIHFKKEWLTLSQIAKKAMLVNISDAIAMNAKPKYALLGVIVPKDFSLKQIKELSSSFTKTAKKYGIKIIGGDTTSGDKLVICITVISSKRKYTLKRTGLKKDDLLAYTGDIGESFKDLNKLYNGEKISKKSRFIEPTLRDEFIKKAAKYLRCGLDISDSLSKDLSRVCALSSLGVEFLIEFTKDELCSGEEYEMLIAFAPKYKDKILQIAKKTNTPINIFARAKGGRYESECKEHHF